MTWWGWVLLGWWITAVLAAVLIGMVIDRAERTSRRERPPEEATGGEQHELAARRALRR